MSKYIITAGGTPVDCPNRINQPEQKLITERDIPPRVGEDATNHPEYQGTKNCYAWVSAFSCDDVECGLGKIVSIEEIV